MYIICHVLLVDSIKYLYLYLYAEIKQSLRTVLSVNTLSETVCFWRHCGSRENIVTKKNVKQAL